MTNSLDDIYKKLINGITDYFQLSRLHRAVVGVSGGIDSALTLKLAVDALGANKVTAIAMPEMGITSSENIQHAKILSNALGVEFFLQHINSFLVPFAQLPWKSNAIALQNTKARIRAVILYNYANTHSALVLGTSNKSELLLGYGTKYGDLASDIIVLGDLYKEEVVALADHLGLPREIIDKKPSAELYPGQTDEEELGASYSELDPILKRIDLGINDLIERGISPTLVHNVFNRVEKNRHKAGAPPIISIT